MCATTSALLVDDGFADLGDLAGLFNGIFDGDKNAGYIGDIFGTNGAAPSMENADYKADLDAVNLAARIQNGESSITAADFFRSLLLSSNEFIEM